MKKLLIIAGALLFCTWSAHSEVIESVGYNPTRFGQYKRLKVSSGIEIPAGLVSPKAQSGGNLQLEACQDGCTNPAYKIDYLKASQIVQGTNTTFEVEKVTANSGTVTLNNGGEISSAIGAGKVAVGQLEATTSTLVVGNSLKLGKGTIPVPSGRTECQWVWENVTHKDGTAKVLALKGCVGGEGPVATCEQRDYLLAHKAECCPSEPYSNGDCYTPGPLKYFWQNQTDQEADLRCRQSGAQENSACLDCSMSRLSVEDYPGVSEKNGQSCSTSGEILYIQRTWCPKVTGWGCDCKGGEVINKVYLQCMHNSYEKVGW